ncbi:MAG TPA: hypothetical protein VE986_08935, partial [Hyphomicrobiales bacterium]|nr:hypothetical protein [Hyphomicrobiales bacterium]
MDKPDDMAGRAKKGARGNNGHAHGHSFGGSAAAGRNGARASNGEHHTAKEAASYRSKHAAEKVIVGEAGAAQRDWSKTLFLPKTDFSMKAGLPQLEPKLLARWEKMNLYKL